MSDAIALPRTWLVALVGLVAALASSRASAADQWVVYEGKDGPGKGKHVVLVSGDDEYRSEEGLPQLGKILATRHGFRCTVLFPIDPKTGEIKPDYPNNIPGLAALDSADLMIILTRFRDLPDEQMAHVVKYLESGKPIIGLRTATHAFNVGKGKKYEKYGWNYVGKDYEQGFGRQVLGETWIAHHGSHGHESTRGLPAPDAAEHPILRGIKEGSIWGDSDVYTVRLPLPADCQPIVLGQVLDGMSPESKPVAGKKNDPMMPVAWVKGHKADGGNDKDRRVFTTTMGAATDLTSEGTRRMIVNAAYWALAMEDKIAPSGSDVGLVGAYQPTKFGFGGYKKGVKPAEHELKPQ